MNTRIPNYTIICLPTAIDKYELQTYTSGNLINGTEYITQYTAMA